MCCYLLGSYRFFVFPVNKKQNTVPMEQEIDTLYRSPVPDLAHLHKLDTMNRFFVNLFILRVWRMQETYALEEVRDKTDKRDVA